LILIAAAVSLKVEFELKFSFQSLRVEFLLTALQYFLGAYIINLEFVVIVVYPASCTE